jgi:hypothetical protein
MAFKPPLQRRKLLSKTHPNSIRVYLVSKEIPPSSGEFPEY